MWAIISGLPIEGALFEDVDVGDSEDAGESGHAEEGHAAVGFVLHEVRILNCPWIHEDDLDVEDDEEHGDEVEFHAEAWGSVADGEHAAFVGDVFHSVAAGPFAEDDAHDEHAGREAGGHEDLHEDGEVVREHGKIKNLRRNAAQVCKI